MFAIWAEGGVVHLGQMSFEAPDQFARNRVPQQSGAVVGCCHHEESIGTEYSTPYGRSMTFQHHSGRASCYIPNARGLVGRGCDDVPTVWTEGDAPDDRTVPAKNRKLLTSISVANDDGFVVGHCDQLAIRAEGGCTLPGAVRGVERNLVTRIGIPQSDCVVIGRRKDATTVGAKYGAAHRPIML